MTQSRRKFLKRSVSALAAVTIVPRYVLGGPGYTAPSDKINLGFIGTGKQGLGLGKRFLELDDIQLVAASDVDQSKLERFRKVVEGFYAEKSGKSSYQGCTIHEDYGNLLSWQDVDAVVIATPDHWHAKQVIEAAKAGKDIFCEKPLSHTIKEGRAMVKAVRKYNRILQTGSMQRSREDFRKACELVRNGYIGEIKNIKVSVGDPAIPCDLPAEPVPDGLNWDKWLGPAPERAYNAIICPPITDDSWAMWRKYKEYGGGIFSDWGAHMFDIVQWGIGMDDSGPVEITPPDGKNLPHLTYRYANGITMTHENFGKGHAVMFEGSEGTIEISRRFFNSKPKNLTNQKIKSGEVHLYNSKNHYVDWIQSIRSRKAPICDVETGHRTATICHLGNIAYELKRPLRWDPVKEKFTDDKEANGLRTKKMRKPYKTSV